VAEGSLKASEISEELFKEGLFTFGIPDPDLLWRDFTRDNLAEAILDYQGRERRFGLVKDKVGILIKNLLRPNIPR